MSFCCSLHTGLPPVLEEEAGMSDTVILAQNSGDVVPAQSKVCLEAAYSEKCLQAVRCPHGDGFLGLDLGCIENQLCIHILP